MPDPTKHIPLISDLKTLFSLLKTRKTVAFLYGFIFAFLAFTLCLAFFNSSSNNSSSSPWFSNIFSSSLSSKPISDNSYRSQFSSVFTYFFPNSSQPNFTRSINSTLQLPIQKLNPNHTSIPPKTQVFKPQNNTTGVTKTPATPKKAPVNNNITINQKPKNPEKSPANNSLIANSPAKTPISGEISKIPANNSLIANSPAKTSISGENSKIPANKTTSESGLLAKKPSNVSNTKSLGKDEREKWLESLVNCNLFDGNWVKDELYPLYKPGSCSLIDEQFNCFLNGRPDKGFQQLKWKPKGCDLKRLNASHMLELLRGKRVVFVGDSLNRNMWESLVCILRNSVKDQSKVFEASGRQHFRGEASYSFIFKDYGFSIEFFVSPFLVQEWEMTEKNGSKKETLRLDLVGRAADKYKNADVIIFNTGHWWTHDKTSRGKDYYQEGSHVYSELDVSEAFRKALTTWGRWVDANVNPKKSHVFFRGYSASHFSGGQWNSGGACDSETEPIKNETYLTEYPSKMLVLEKVLRGMKTRVSYLNITRITDYRKDGHPSIYRKQKFSDAEKREPLIYQDCSHWCLPGVPDTWNEILYHQLLIKQYQNLKRL